MSLPIKKLLAGTARAIGYLLLSLLVLAAIGAFFVSGEGYILSDTKKDSTASRLRSLQTSLRAYKEDFGHCPDSLRQLKGEHNGKYDYLARQPIDDWNNDYVYRRDAGLAQGFVLYSRGENQIDEQDGGDDSVGGDPAQ